MADENNNDMVEIEIPDDSASVISNANTNNINQNVELDIGEIGDISNKIIDKLTEMEQRLFTRAMKFLLLLMMLFSAFFGVSVGLPIGVSYII